MARSRMKRSLIAAFTRLVCSSFNATLRTNSPWLAQRARQAHATLAERAQNPIRADAASGKRRWLAGRAGDGVGDHPAGLAPIAGPSDPPQQVGDNRRELRLAAGQRGAPVGAPVVRQVQRLVEQQRDARHLGGIEIVESHRSLRRGQESCISCSRNARAFSHSRSTVRIETLRSSATSFTERPVK